MTRPSSPGAAAQIAAAAARRHRTHRSATAPTAATRSLCAAAWIDGRFRRLALREVYDRRRRAPAPSAGFDLVEVIRHCRSAYRTQMLMDSATVAIAVVTMATALPAAVDVLAALVLVRIVAEGLTRAHRRLWRTMSKSTDVVPGLLAPFMPVELSLPRIEPPVGRGRRPSRRRRRPTTPEAEVSASARDSRTLTFLSVGVAVALVVAVFAAVLDVHARGLRALAASTPLAWPREFSSLLVAAAALATVSVTGALWTRHRLAGLADVRPPCPSTYLNDRHLDKIALTDASNRTVYGGPNPFIGTGVELGRWSFAGRLLQAQPWCPPGADPQTEEDRDFVTPPFTTEELVACLRSKLSALGHTDSPEQGLLGLTVRDRVLVPSGHGVERSTPVTAAELAAIMRHPTGAQRHYLMCQVIAWDGELVTTTFLHCAAQASTLYLEFTHTALPPCLPVYRAAPQEAESSGRAMTIISALAGIPAEVAVAPVRLSLGLHDAVTARLRHALTVLHLRAGDDPGALLSLREAAATAEEIVHAQTRDIVKHRQMIERRILGCVSDFLTTHHVDTAEFLQRAATVLNAGVVNTGSGTVNVSGDAVGQSTARPPAAP